MLNLTAARTVGVARYNLSQINKTLDEKIDRFLEYLLRQKHVLYDWGQHQFFVCSVPFLLDYEKGPATTEDGRDYIGDECWIGCDPDELHDILVNVFEGEWGPTATDTILRMENSGVRVDICGTSEFGPSDPREFLESLQPFIKKAQLVSSQV
jgi:hypothetical protein